MCNHSGLVEIEMQSAWRTVADSFRKRFAGPIPMYTR